MADEERRRLSGTAAELARWRRWGPYLSERSWGTVREDYSADGRAWDFLPHDSARSKAYRWGEDGIGGFCDRYQVLCVALALWNERDPILKERYFGLVPSEGNHGEDVKECYYFLDALPSHAYQRLLYKYPQAEFPYGRLIEENRRRSGQGPEFELLDTGLFDEGRYFDVEIEIAKNEPEDIAIRITAHNRGPDPAPLHLLPHLWFRNTWSWGPESRSQPSICELSTPSGVGLLADDSAAPPLPGLPASSRLGPFHLHLAAGGERLFTDNETNASRLWGAAVRPKSPYVKDAFHRYVVNGETDAVNPARIGTKACARYRFDVPARDRITLRLRLVNGALDVPGDPLATVDEIVDRRRSEADEFYDRIHPARATKEERNVQRQALAGMLWSKQIYLFDVAKWQDGDDPSARLPEARKHGRNRHWRHLNSHRILSMPDTWEYPWFAAWDLAFHAVTLAVVDPDLAKEQLWLMLFEQFQHPNGQIPAYEWEFSDLNPPVHAWAVWRVYNMDRLQRGRADRAFLERCFHKLMINFTWWVNEVDSQGNNVFEGGFLGLDNITVIDRSEQLPGGVVLEQSDATGWMGMFCLVMMRIALELSKQNDVYQGLATKFFEHYVYVGSAMKQMGRGGQALWNDEDGFFYDILRSPDGSATSFGVRSTAGLVPLYAVERLERDWIKPFPYFQENLDWFLENRRWLVDRTVSTVSGAAAPGTTHVLAVVDHEQLRRLLARVVDAGEFMSPFGMRSLSKYHGTHPFVFGGAEVRYEPGEAVSKIKGGNSNWRGPVWFPTNFLMIESLRKLEKALGDRVRIPMDDGTTTGNVVTLSGLAKDLAERLISIFVPGPDGRRPLYGPAGTKKSDRYATDPHFKDLVLFFEYFHGDHGEGLGASHQTGWTGLVANLIDEWRR